LQKQVETVHVRQVILHIEVKGPLLSRSGLANNYGKVRSPWKTWRIDALMIDIFDNLERNATVQKSIRLVVEPESLIGIEAYDR